VTWQRGVAVDPPPDEPEVAATLAQAVAEWNAQPPGTRGVIVLMGSDTLVEDVHVDVPEGSHLLVTAGQWPEEPTGDALDPMARRTGRVVPRSVRPHVRGTVEVAGTAPAGSASPGTLVLDGLLLEGALDIVDGHLGLLQVSHCTLAPGATVLSFGANPELRVSLERAITGPVTPGEVVSVVTARDTIVAGDLAARSLDVSAVTVLGRTTAETIEATDSIFSGRIVVERRQTGCVRFSYVADGSTVPRRYRCAPAAGTTARPAFVSTTFGDPAYGVLAPGCPDAIARGAEDGGEMGAWHFLHVPQRIDNVRRALDEYLRFGLEAGTAFAP
jgi:hypothetical protein